MTRSSTITGSAAWYKQRGNSIFSDPPRDLFPLNCSTMSESITAG